MTRTEELLALAEAATPGPWRFVIDGAYKLQMPSDRGGVSTQMCDEQYYPWVPDRKADWEHIAAANPETIKQLVELCRLQHVALIELSPCMYKECQQVQKETQDHAIAAFNKFEQGGE